MREAFEKLPEIARHIHKFVYQDDLNCYRNKIKSSDIHLVTWVNGAWYAFQEQQKRIDAIYDVKQKMVERVIELSAEIEKLENRIRRMG